MKTQNLGLQIKSLSIEEEQGIIEAYANVKWFKDKASDVSIDGAFIKSVEHCQSTGKFPKLLLQHDYKQVCGVWLEMNEDEKGLRVKGKLALNTTIGKETYELIKMGALDSLSIGYVVKKERYDPQTKTNFLEEVDIKEISIVTFPCNEESIIDTVKTDELEQSDSNEKAIEVVSEYSMLNISSNEEVLNEQTNQSEFDSINEKLDEFLAIQKLNAFLNAQ